MGYYINPKERTKEQWLAKNGKEISEADAKNHKAEDKLLVVLVDNGDFTAAGIAYDDLERDAFLRPDGRDKKFFLVSRDRLYAEGFL